MAKCIKQCDTCGKVYTTPTARRNCVVLGCYGSLKKYDERKDWSRKLIKEIAREVRGNE